MVPILMRLTALAAEAAEDFIPAEMEVSMAAEARVGILRVPSVPKASSLSHTTRSRPACLEILRPERPWEGANAPRQPSIRSTAYGTVNQLRDPAIYTEGDDVYLLYAVAGESGIALARLDFTP